MIIANPLYDVTFKKMLENNRVAKFFIGMILDCEIVSLEPSPQEWTTEIEKKDDEKTTLNGEKRGLTTYRVDFSATIRTKEDGTQKVLIELQKTFSYGDIYRFRKYLGKEYYRSNLPLISIYILGFTLPIKSPAFKARPDCYDLFTKEKLTIKNDYVTLLTHTAYFIQAPRIKPAYHTRLEKLLSIFEQANFVGETQITKSFETPDIDPEITEIVKILEYVASDKELREKLDKEEDYKDFLEAKFGDKDRKLAAKDKLLEENEIKLAEKENVIIEQKDAIAQKDEIIKKTALELKSLNIPTEKISQITGLSAAEIEDLTDE